MQEPSADALTNATRPPEYWQVYEITFRAPRFNGATKTENARITAYLNDVLIQDDTDVPVPLIGEEAPLGQLLLQSHLNHSEHPRYRNIWIEELTLP